MCNLRRSGSEKRPRKVSVAFYDEQRRQEIPKQTSFFRRESGDVENDQSMSIERVEKPRPVEQNREAWGRK